MKLLGLREVKELAKFKCLGINKTRIWIRYLCSQWFWAPTGQLWPSPTRPYFHGVFHCLSYSNSGCLLGIFTGSTSAQSKIYWWSWSIKQSLFIEFLFSYLIFIEHFPCSQCLYDKPWRIEGRYTIQPSSLGSMRSSRGLEKGRLVILNHKRK